MYTTVYIHMNICICIQSYKYFDISRGFLRDLHLRFGYWAKLYVCFGLWGRGFLRDLHLGLGLWGYFSVPGIRLGGSSLFVYFSVSGTIKCFRMKTSCGQRAERKLT